jgi:hypothetical protein
MNKLNFFDNNLINKEEKVMLIKIPLKNYNIYLLKNLK